MLKFLHMSILGNNLVGFSVGIAFAKNEKKDILTTQSVKET